MWFPVVAFGNQAGWIVDKLGLEKGDHIALEGQLTTSYQEGEDGKRKKQILVVASSTYLTATSRRRREFPWLRKGPPPPF